MSVKKTDKEKEFIDGYTVPAEYADWLKQQGGVNYTTDIAQTDTAKYYEEALKRAQESARGAYDKSVTDANTRYRFNTAAYGSGAEQKINSGISNSGYAKYLTDRAYSTMVDEQIAAKGALAAANREAESAYNDSMEALRTGQKASFDTLLQRVNSGEFNDFGNISMLGLNADLSNEQMSTLYGAYIKANENKATNVFNAALDGVNSGAYTTFDQVISSVGNTNLTNQQRESLYNAFMGKKASDAAQAGDDIGYLESAVAAGQLSTIDASKKVLNALNDTEASVSDFVKLFNRYNDSGLLLDKEKSELGDYFTNALKSSGSSIFYVQDENGNVEKMNSNAAKTLVDEIIATGLLNSIDVESLRRTYTVAYIGSAELAAQDAAARDAERDATVRRDLEMAAQQPVAVQAAEYAKLQKISDGKLFRYGGEDYIYFDGKAYNTGTSQDNHLTDILNMIYAK